MNQCKQNGHLDDVTVPTITKACNPECMLLLLLPLLRHRVLSLISMWRLLILLPPLLLLFIVVSVLSINTVVGIVVFSLIVVYSCLAASVMFSNIIAMYFL